MASFEGSIGVPSGGFNLKVEYSYTQSISGNYSDVTATAYVKRNNSSYYPYNSSSSASLVIDGTSKSYTGSYNLGSDGYKTITSNTKRVYHNNDGTKSITISFSFNGLLSNYYPNGSISKTITLTTIARATAAPDLSGYIGRSYNYTITPANSSFTHSLKISKSGLADQWLQSDGSFGSSEYKFSSKSPLINIPKTYYSQFSGPTDNRTITLYTYNGSTSIGNKTGKLTVSCDPILCTPFVEGTAEVTDDLSKELTGNNADIIRYISSVIVKPTIQISDVEDTTATITSKKINGVEFTTDNVTIPFVESNDFELTVTNSRGLSKTVTISTEGNVISYVPVTFSGNAYRKEPTTGEVEVEYNGNYYNGSFGKEDNNLLITWYYKLKGEEEYSLGGNLTPTINEDNITYGTNKESLGSIFIYTNQYDIKIVSKDKIGEYSQTFNITQGIPIFWWDSQNIHIPNGDLYIKDLGIYEILSKPASYGQYKLTQRYTQTQSTPWSQPVLNFGQYGSFTTNDNELFEASGNEIICKFKGTVLIMVRVSSNNNINNEFDAVIKVKNDGYESAENFLTIYGSTSVGFKIQEINYNDRISLSTNYSTTAGITIYDGAKLIAMKI